ncbi:hypothetical protein C3B61_13845 [Cryobacterium zongtaii]|uniref:Uncharacterized protein n=1 Tax=Cryobacterium zongtaii TaxID=1259217 RepID=A0A2S3ZCB3_9MICO|nr:hypothetical protein C3B61_13845 [Cryobacterium zongtaii]
MIAASRSGLRGRSAKMSRSSAAVAGWSDAVPATPCPRHTRVSPMRSSTRTEAGLPARTRAVTGYAEACAAARATVAASVASPIPQLAGVSR